MFSNNHTTTEVSVKILAPFQINPSQRREIADGKFISTAAPAGRQHGEYLYSATVTLLHERSALYTTAPAWASVEISNR